MAGVRTRISINKQKGNLPTKAQVEGGDHALACDTFAERSEAEHAAAGTLLDIECPQVTHRLSTGSRPPLSRWRDIRAQWLRCI